MLEQFVGYVQMHGIVVLASLYKLECLTLGIRSKYVCVQLQLIGGTVFCGEQPSRIRYWLQHSNTNAPARAELPC